MTPMQRRELEIKTLAIKFIFDMCSSPNSDVFYRVEKKFYLDQVLKEAKRACKKLKLAVSVSPGTWRGQHDEQIKGLVGRLHADKI